MYNGRLLSLTNAREINSKDNLTEEEMSRKTRRWNKFSLFVHHYLKKIRNDRLSEIKTRRIEPIHVSDVESSSSSDDTSISLINEPVPLFNFQANRNEPFPLQSAATEFKSLSHIVQRA